MSRVLTPDDALETIPGWAGAGWQALEGGETNCNYLVESDGRKAVLKIDATPRGAPFSHRRDEAQVQSMAARHGLAAQVLFASDAVYLTEYLEGRVWTPETFRDEDSLEALATALRTLHNLPLTGRVFDAAGAAVTYASQIKDADPELVGHCLRVVKATPLPQNLCCCHNDLVAENIIDADGIRLLDWEYACDNDRLFDLATVVAHHDLPSGSAHALLDACFGGDGSRWRDQLLAQERCYEALTWLWQAARRTRGVSYGSS